MMTQDLILSLLVSKNHKERIYNTEIIGVIRGRKDDMQELETSVFAFTVSGTQLIRAIQPQINDQYALDCLKLIKEENKDYIVTAHRVKYIDDRGNLDHDDIDLLSEKESKMIGNNE